MKRNPAEMLRRLFPSPSEQNFSEQNGSTEQQTSVEWREEGPDRILVYKRVGKSTLIYQEIIQENGTPTLVYLPYESLDYAAADSERTLPPVIGSTLNFLIR